VSIYKACDIRGDAAQELTPSLYERWGDTLGRQLPPRTKFVVGGDVRESSPIFLAALVKGLAHAGLDVIDLGLLPSPMIYYAMRRLRAGGCAIVTAAHDPWFVNGLQWMVGNRPPFSEDVAAVEHAAAGEANGDNRIPTAPRTLDVTFDYVACLQERFVESMDAQFHIVLDPRHASWAEKVRRYLHAIFPQCLFSTIHDTFAPRFGGCALGCSRLCDLAELSSAVYRQRAHLGIAFDGDGDGIAVVDDRGVALSAEETACLLLRSFGEQLRGERFVYDLAFSDRVAEEAKRLGAEPIAEHSGQAFLLARMTDSGAIFGAGSGGHFYFRDRDGSDDGLYATCLLIEYLARCKRAISDLRAECPPIHVTPDLCLAMPMEDQPKVVRQICEAWSQFPQTTLDGVRINLPGGWALVRSSGVDPVLTFRFEGIDWHALEDLVERFCDALPGLGDELWACYRAAMNGR